MGHGAAGPGEQTVNGLSRQRTASLGHQLPAGGEEEHSTSCFLNLTGAERRWLHFSSVKLKGSFSLPHAQEKAEGEPKVKKGKTLLDDASGEDSDEGVDESLEEVRGFKCLPK